LVSFHPNSSKIVEHCHQCLSAEDNIGPIKK